MKLENIEKLLKIIENEKIDASKIESFCCGGNYWESFQIPLKRCFVEVKKGKYNEKGYSLEILDKSKNSFFILDAREEFFKNYSPILEGLYNKLESAFNSVKSLYDKDIEAGKVLNDLVN